MKKIATSFVMCLLFVFVALSPLLMTGCGGKNKLNWDGLSIVGYKNYESIGAVSFAEDGSGSVVSANKKHDNVKLGGKKKDGKFEEVKFEDEDGDVTKQKAKLRHFDAYTRFSFLSFTTNQSCEFVAQNKYKYAVASEEGIFHYGYERTYWEDESETYLFILDNKTGKIYDTREIYKAIAAESLGMLGTITFLNSHTLVDDKCPVDEEFLMVGADAYGAETGKCEYNVFQINFKDKNLEIVYRMNGEQTLNFSGHGREQVVKGDRFGNLFNSTWTYYQKVDGKFVQLEAGATYQLCANDVFYKQKDDKTYYLNRLGEFVEIELEGDLLPTSVKYTSVGVRGAEWLANVGNKMLFAKQSSRYDQEAREVLYTTSILTATLEEGKPWKYTTEAKVVYENGHSDSNATISGTESFVYLVEKGEVFAYNLETEHLQTVESELTFKTLSYNKTYNIVKFVAEDAAGQKVNGYFNQTTAVVGEYVGQVVGLDKVYTILDLENLQGGEQ